MPRKRKPRAQKPRGLIIEDEPHVSAVLTEVLRGCGYRPHAAASAEAADAFLDKHDVGIVLLDLRLPGMTGDEWLAAFRKRERLVPVLAISGVTDPARKVAVLYAGADDYVAKPFEIGELEARIALVQRRKRIDSSLTVCGGKVRIDPAASEMRVGPLRLQLTLRELGVAWHLAAHEGAWVPVERLAEAVLGSPSDRDVADLRVYVFNLRRKIALASDFVRVDTWRSRGYRLRGAPFEEKGDKPSR